MTRSSLLTLVLVGAVGVAIGLGIASLRGGAPEVGDAPFGSPAAVEDPVAAFAEVLEIEDPADRSVALVRFFASADPVWAPLIRERVHAPESGLVLDEVSEMLFASWWAKADPAAAFEHRVDPGWSNRHPWMRSVMREWMRQDPLAAVAATETLPKNPGRGRLEAARVVIDTWFEQEGTADPTPILGLLNQLELKPRARGISRMIHALIETRGLDGAEAFVLAIPSDFEHLGTSLKQEAMSRLAAELLDYDVARAVRWADQQGQGRENAGVRRHLAHYWATRDGPAAMEWALSLPDDTERRVVVKRAWLSFRRTQPEAAAEWLLAQEPNRTLLVIFSRYITSIAKDDPEGAIAIAERAQDPKIRRQLYVAVGKGWMRADPEAAQAWIDEVGLTPAQQQQIRRWAGMENPPPKTG